jgi:hypothetical protein
MGSKLPRILTQGVGVMALVSVLTILGTSAGQTRDLSGHGPISTQQDRALADRALDAVARDIDRASVGDTRVATLLAAEFGVSEETIINEKRDLGASWGNLTIAHALAAGDKQGMTAAQVLHLHDRGMGWGQVAAGLRLELDDAVRTVTREGRVARGLTRTDGRKATILADGF